MVEAQFGFELVGGFSSGNPLNWARNFDKKSTLWR
jgi:hypothetical protein